VYGYGIRTRVARPLEWRTPQSARGVGLTVAGCGIPRDDRPRAVPAGQVDPRLLGTPSPTGTPAATGDSAFDVAFVTPENTLALTRRPVSPGPAVQQVAELLAALTAGPDNAEHAHGLSTALPSDVTLTLTARAGNRTLITHKIKIKAKAKPKKKRKRGKPRKSHAVRAQAQAQLVIKPTGARGL